MALVTGYIAVLTVKDKPGSVVVKLIRVPVLLFMTARTIDSISFIKLSGMDIFMTAITVAFKFLKPLDQITFRGFHEMTVAAGQAFVRALQFPACFIMLKVNI